MVPPISGRSTANEREAAQIVEDIRPRIVIPMHYGGVYGGDGSVEKLREELKKRRVWTMVRPMELYEELTL